MIIENEEQLSWCGNPVVEKHVLQNLYIVYILRLCTDDKAETPNNGSIKKIVIFDMSKNIAIYFTIIY